MVLTLNNYFCSRVNTLRELYIILSYSGTEAEHFIKQKFNFKVGNDTANTEASACHKQRTNNKLKFSRR